MSSRLLHRLAKHNELQASTSWLIKYANSTVLNKLKLEYLVVDVRNTKSSNRCRREQYSS
jgi:hypothetical protein